MSIKSQRPTPKTPRPRASGLMRVLAIAIAATTGAPSHIMAAGALASARLGQHTWGGLGYNDTTYEEAQRQALSRCNQHGPGCRIVVLFNLKCLAVATQVGTGASSWAVRATTAEAQEFVVNQCRSFGRPCEVKAAVCDTVGLPPTGTLANIPPAITAPLSQRSAPVATRFPITNLPDGNAAHTFDGVILIVVLFIGFIIIRVIFGSTSSGMAIGGSASAEYYDHEAARFQAMSRKTCRKLHRGRAHILAFQRTLEKGHGRSNCQTLFGIGKIPSDNYIRDVLDAADPALLQPCFERLSNCSRRHHCARTSPDLATES
jgi:hypothetical protein